MDDSGGTLILGNLHISIDIDMMRYDDTLWLTNITIENHHF